MPDEPPKRPKGRPRAPEPGYSLTTFVRTSDHQKLVTLAQKRDQTVSALVRDLLSGVEARGWRGMAVGAMLEGRAVRRTAWFTSPARS